MRVQRSVSNQIRRPVTLAALSAAAMLAATATQSSAQTWVNPNTGNWSVGANWVGGAAPASGPATALVFNAVGAETYTATNDIANPFQFDSMSLNNSGTGQINIAGSGFTGGTATGGAFIRVNSTGTGASAINNGGTLYSMRVGQGLLNVPGGTWTLESQQRQNDDVGTGGGPINDGFWGLTVGDTGGQTARYLQTGGTVNAQNAFIASAPGSTGIATFTGAGTVFNANIATPNGLLGVNAGNGTINVLAGAVTNSRRVEIGRQNNAVGFLRVDGANSRVQTTTTAGNVTMATGQDTTAGLEISNLGGLVSGAGFFTASTDNAVANVNINNGSLTATGVAVVTGGGGTLNPNAGATTLNLSNNARWQTGTNTFGQEPGLVTINMDATSSINATNRTIISGQGGSAGPGSAVVNMQNGGTFTSGSFINMGGGFATALGDPLEGGVATVNLGNGAFFRAGSSITLGPSPSGVGVINANNSTVQAGTANMAVASASQTFGRATLTNSTLSIGGSMFAGARDPNNGEIIINNTPTTVGNFIVIAGGGGTLNGGQGTMTVTNSAVSAVNVNVAQDSGGRGLLSISGPGSSLTMTTGAGTSGFTMGLEATAHGTVNLSNTTVNLNGGTAQMVVGSSGNGTFLMADSTMNVGNTVFIGAGTTSTGFANVSNSTMALGAQLQVGGSGGTAGGASTMNVVNNSNVTTTDLMNVYTTGTLNIGAGTTKARVAVGGDSVVNGVVNFNSGTFITTGTLGVGGSVLLSSAARNPAGTPSNKKLVEVGQATLTTSGVIDLNDNDMLVHDTTPGALQKYETFVKNARNNGAWDQPGITSTAAKNSSPQNKGLGVVSGADFHSANGGAGALFNGRTVAATDTMIKFTFNGDTDLNGVVNFDDYARTDSGFNNGRTGWFNGDFDYNGLVNFDDYGLIDLAFNTQSGVVLSAGGDPAGPAADRQIVSISLSDAQQMIVGGQAFDVQSPLEQIALASDNNLGNGGLQAVPEPGALSLIGLGALAAMRRRRRSI